MRWARFNFFGFEIHLVVKMPTKAEMNGDDESKREALAANGLFTTSSLAPKTS